MQEVLEKFFKRYPSTDNLLAIGVSGGADSLALVLLMHNWALQNGRKIVALTVDHGLRKESGKEAKYVAELMRKNGIEHHILVWNGEKPKNGVEEAARKARYQLMQDWCRMNQSGSLLIAHNKQDQAETFLMRLQRGSGVDGLAGMSPLTYRDGIWILRPLLEVYPEELRKYLKDRKIKWIEDPSNQSNDFLRCRVRKLLPKLEKEIGLTIERLTDTADRMAVVRDYLKIQTGKFIKNNVKNWNGAGYSIALDNILHQHPEMAQRVLAELLQQVGQKIYRPRLEDLQRLYQALQDENYRTRTLCGCEILTSQDKVWIVPELKGEVELSKQEWEAFCVNHPEFQHVHLPYKLRLSLYKLLA